jgi:hypothetical protein
VNPARFARLAGVPFLFVWGDYIDGSPVWRRARANIEAFSAALAGGGAAVEWWDLPGLGIHGNGHMLMMDRNSDTIAARIQEWMERAGLMKETER